MRTLSDIRWLITGKNGGKGENEKGIERKSRTEFGVSYRNFKRKERKIQKRDATLRSNKHDLRSITKN